MHFANDVRPRADYPNRPGRTLVAAIVLLV